MPYLNALATFRDSVRKEARSLKATAILNECDRIRDDVLPNLGVRLEDKVKFTTRPAKVLAMISINSSEKFLIGQISVYKFLFPGK